MPKPKSQKQAAYLGAIISGAVSNPRLTKADARRMLRNTDIKHLPKTKR